MRRRQGRTDRGNGGLDPAESLRIRVNRSLLADNPTKPGPGSPSPDGPLTAVCSPGATRSGWSRATRSGWSRATGSGDGESGDPVGMESGRPGRDGAGRTQFAGLVDRSATVMMDGLGCGQSSLAPATNTRQTVQPLGAHRHDERRSHHPRPHTPRRRGAGGPGRRLLERGHGQPAVPNPTPVVASPSPASTESSPPVSPSAPPSSAPSVAARSSAPATFVLTTAGNRNVTARGAAASGPPATTRTSRAPTSFFRRLARQEGSRPDHPQPGLDRNQRAGRLRRVVHQSRVPGNGRDQLRSGDGRRLRLDLDDHPHAGVKAGHPGHDQPRRLRRLRGSDRRDLDDRLLRGIR